MPMFEHRQKNHYKRYGGPIRTSAGFMRYILMTPSGMINAERFSILPTQRINFKRGPDRITC
jgi:hypothetical protein